MADSRASPGSVWFPSLLAAGIALGMLWLAGAPFELAAPGSLELLEPAGDTAGFPHHYSWSEFEGAELYEVTVRVQGPEGSIVFRERETSTALDLSAHAGAEPDSGQFWWQVRAFDGSQVVASAVNTFRILSR